MGLEKLLSNKYVVAVVGNQFGDEGKGKIVDVLTDWARIVVRGTGGANAGHTICAGGTRHALHLIPSGILHDGRGKINIIGRGVAFDPRVFRGELETLKSRGLTYDHLYIDYRAKLILPHHILLDMLAEAASSRMMLGTTKRGIGPCYEDHVGRRGLIVNDLLNPAAFKAKLARALHSARQRLVLYDPERISDLMHQQELGRGAYYDHCEIFDIEAIHASYRAMISDVERMICETETMVQPHLGRSLILLEGAQGLLLGINHGTYPYVTSSDSSVAGLAHGAGLDEGQVDLVLGVVKAYMTRVGEGPFPTELNQEQSHAFRERGNEYGTTTGRPRRIGWLDLPLLRYATGANGRGIVITKLDVLDACETVLLCDKYRYTGPEYRVGTRTLHYGATLNRAIPDPYVLERCQPEYEELPGWRCETQSVRVYRELPQQTLAFLHQVRDRADVRIAALSVGPQRDQIIVD